MKSLIKAIKWLLFGEELTVITSHPETNEIIGVVYVKKCNSQFSTPMYLYGEE
jgi:hypothetical protein